MKKMDTWFRTLNRKLDKVSEDVLGVRGELSEIRDFIEQHQTDIRLCKLAIEHVDDKIEWIQKSP